VRKVSLRFVALLALASVSLQATHVRGYTKKDGTVVQAYERKSPALCSTCSRDARHRIERSAAARSQFKTAHPCPSTGRRSGACPGYAVDHVKPLACGGANAPENMQWQGLAASKAKDKWERAGCML